MIKPKFIGTISIQEGEPVIESGHWKPTQFDLIPYSVINPAPNFLLTLGSGCYASLATTSTYGQRYNSGIDVFRQDYKDSRIVFDAQCFRKYPTVHV